jgi:eukaryotic-like serine/threonine-protein kinase
MQAWEPNQPIQNGRFIIQKVLGGGGFGVTYSAIEYPMGKLVVIKTLKPQQQSQPDFNRRQLNFVNEGMRLAKCNHPHIVRAREFIDEDGLLGMVMEYVDGSDLAECIIIS